MFNPTKITEVNSKPAQPAEPAHPAQSAQPAQTKKPAQPMQPARFSEILYPVQGYKNLYFQKFSAKTSIHGKY